MGNISCIAVDWSGNKRDGDQKRKIWVAEARGGRLVDLQDGRTRLEVVRYLLERIGSRDLLVIGIDFAFSFPQWYLEDNDLQSAPALWARAADHGEDWLGGNEWPFWGGRRNVYQNLPEGLTVDRQFRETDWFHGGESVFHIDGPANVGTGTVRGLPHLAKMRCAGAAIWPFDAAVAGRPVVVEIYPRAFYGNRARTNTSDAAAESRRMYLDRVYPCPALEEERRNDMIHSGDAFDAGVSALVMSAHVGDLQRLRQATERPVSVEGEIWAPLIRRWFHG